MNKVQIHTTTFVRIDMRNQGRIQSKRLNTKKLKSTFLWKYDFRYERLESKNPLRSYLLVVLTNTTAWAQARN